MGTRKFQPELLLAGAHDISPGLGISANAGVVWANHGAVSYGQIFGSVSLGFKVSNRTGAFAELFGFSRTEPGGAAQKFVDAGFTYALSL